MYGDYHPSTPQKRLNLSMHALGVAIAGWILLGGGMSGIGVSLGLAWTEGDSVRRVVLFLFALTFLVRQSCTLLLFMKRRVGWMESVWVGLALWTVHPLLALAGGTDPQAMGPIDWVAVGLYISGSLLNTVSQWQRRRFKSRPENLNRLYTGGLFVISIHVNFLGEVILFAGYALLTGSLVMLALPGLIALVFAVLFIPKLDEHLVARYGVAYRIWRRDHFRFIPLVY